MRDKTKDLTKDSPLKLIIQFAWPMFLGMLFQQVYNIVDAMIVGKTLGVDALAGVGATSSVNFLIIGFCMGICSGFAIPVAQQFGAGKYSELRKYVYNSLYLSIIFSAVITITAVYFTKEILIIMRADPSLFWYSYNYIVVIFIGIPTVFLYNMISGIIRSLGDSKTPVVFLILSAAINVILDLVFILCFKMGVAGAGWATNIAQLISGLGCLIYMQKKYPILKEGTKLERISEKKFSKRHMLRLCGIGVPMGLQYSITAIGSVILQAGVNMLGASYVAAMAAGSRIFNFTCCPLNALGATMATYAGQNVGAGKIDRLGKGVRAAVIIGCIYSVLCALVLYFTVDYMSLLFVDSSEIEIIQLTRRYMLISAIFYFSVTFVNVIRFTIQGMGYSTLSIVAGVFEMVARTYVALLLIPAYGYVGACLANPLAWIAADVFLIPEFFYCRNKFKFIK